jgi:hypothetical protein
MKILYKIIKNKFHNLHWHCYIHHNRILKTCIFCGKEKINIIQIYYEHCSFYYRDNWV